MVEHRKVVSRSRYLWAFIIGTVLFFGVFGFTNYLSYLELDRISDLQVQTSYDIFEDKVQYGLFGKSLCEDNSLKEVSESLRFQGKIIDDLENDLGKDNEKVLSRKRFYTLVELEHLDFVNLLNEECNNSISTILFFYSNDARNLDESEELGRLLGSVHNRNADIFIYSFDVDLDSSLIESLKEKYGIEDYNTLVINEEITVYRPESINEIEIFL